MKCNVVILFVTLECVWESDVEISCKGVACELEYTILYMTYGVCYNLFDSTQGCINTLNCKCPLQLENPIASLIVKPYISHSDCFDSNFCVNLILH